MDPPKLADSSHPIFVYKGPFNPYERPRSVTFRICNDTIWKLIRITFQPLTEQISSLTFYFVHFLSPLLLLIPNPIKLDTKKVALVS